MNVLILGGSGYIGERLTELLIRKKYNVSVATRKSNKILNPKIKQLFEIDWNNLSSLQDACRGNEIIINAAGASSKDSEENYKEVINFSKVGTTNLVKAATMQSVKKMIYLSTAHVYSSSMTGKINENSKLNNNSPYALAHSIAEQITLEAQSKSFIDTKVLRLANCFGAPVSINSNCWYILINDICKQAVIEKQINIRSKVNNVRNFVPITTVVSFIEYLIAFDQFKLPQLINVGERHSLSIKDVVSRVISRLDAKLNITPNVKFHFEKQNPQSLDYETQILKQMGFDKYFPFEKEIDNLIMYCNEFFR